MFLVFTPRCRVNTKRPSLYGREAAAAGETEWTQLVAGRVGEIWRQQLQLTLLIAAAPHNGSAAPLRVPSFILWPPLLPSPTSHLPLPPIPPISHFPHSPHFSRSSYFADFAYFCRLPLHPPSYHLLASSYHLLASMSHAQPTPPNPAGSPNASGPSFAPPPLPTGW